MKKFDHELDIHDDSSASENTINEEILSKRKTSTHERNEEMVPPDGGWGWMIVLGSLISNVLGALPIRGFSVLFYPILVSHGTSSTKISWIFNLASAVWSLTVLPLGPLAEEFGFRKVAMFGAIANFLSLFFSAFVQNPDYLFITYVLPAGISGSTSFGLGMLIVSTYFKKHKGLAIGITTTGACLSSFLAPIVANYLLEHFGFMGAALILSAICLNRCAAASLYHPVEWHMKRHQPSSNDNIILLGKILPDSQDTESEKELEVRDKNLPMESTNTRTNSKDSACSINNINEKKVDSDLSKHISARSTSKFLSSLKSTFNSLKALKYMRVHLIASSYGTLIIGFANFNLLVPFVVTNLGYTLEIGAWCTSVASIGDISARIVMSLLADRKFFRIECGYMSGFFLMGLSFIALSFVSDLKALIALSCCFGIGAGFCFALCATYMIEIMGMKMLAAVFGISALANVVEAVIIAPLIGIIRDKTQSFTYVLWMLGGIELLIFLTLFLMPYAQKFDTWKYSATDKKKKSLQS